MTRFEYDRNDQLVTELRPDETVRYRYDEAGNRTSTMNGASETTQYVYDTWGNLIRTILPMGAGDTNTGYYVTTSYDNQGNKIREGNGTGDFQTWAYNNQGVLTGHTDLGGTRFTYDHAGNRIGQISTIITPTVIR